MPAIARPTVPPIWRKKVRLLVATPSFENGTAFWTMIVKTDSVGPMPTPVTNIHSEQRGVIGRRGQLVISDEADGHDRDARQDEHLVVAGPRRRGCPQMIELPIRPISSGKSW